MVRQFAVIGLGRFGLSVAKTLSEEGCEVIAIDKREDNVAEAADFVTSAIQIDATDEKALKSLGIFNMNAVILCIGTNIQASILTALLLKELGVKEIVAKAINQLHKKALLKIGVDRVVLPEIDMGIRLGKSLVRPGVSEHIELSKDHTLMEILAPKRFIGKTLREANIRAKFRLNVIGIKRKLREIDNMGSTLEKEAMDINPSADDIIARGDMLVVLGKNKDVEKFKENGE